MPHVTLAEKLINSPLAAKAGVPQGYPLRRHQAGEPALDGPIVIGGVGTARVAEYLRSQLAVDYQIIDTTAEAKRAALVFDATGLETPEQLRELYDFCLLYTSPSPRDRG